MPSVGSTPTSSPSPVQQSLLHLDNHSDSLSSSLTTPTTTTTAPSNLRTIGNIPKNSNANNSGLSRLKQFMIITPAVTIDRNCNNETPMDPYYSNESREHFEFTDYESLNSLNNNMANNLRSTNNFRRPLPCRALYNRSNLLSWRWCTLLCAAMRCFGAGGRSTHSQNGNFATTTTTNTTGQNCNFRSTHNNSTPTRNVQYTLPRRNHDRLDKFTYEL